MYHTCLAALRIALDRTGSPHIKPRERTWQATDKEIVQPFFVSEMSDVETWQAFKNVKARREHQQRHEQTLLSIAEEETWQVISAG